MMNESVIREMLLVSTAGEVGRGRRRVVHF